MPYGLSRDDIIRYPQQMTDPPTPDRLVCVPWQPWRVLVMYGLTWRNSVMRYWSKYAVSFSCVVPEAFWFHGSFVLTLTCLYLLMLLRAFVFGQTDSSSKVPWATRVWRTRRRQSRCFQGHAVDYLSSLRLHWTVGAYRSSYNGKQQCCGRRTRCIYMQDILSTALHDVAKTTQRLFVSASKDPAGVHSRTTACCRKRSWRMISEFLPQRMSHRPKTSWMNLERLLRTHFSRACRRLGLQLRFFYHSKAAFKR